MSIIKRGDVQICERYRPRKLNQIYGNESAVKNLYHMLSQSPTARQKCYLFAGSRGSGKTTTARILAMGLNCEQGDTGDPCLECSCCQDGMKENAVFINQINCSKYTKKEEMFELSNQFHDFPFIGRNNIYILDELHKLTSGSQNLLLKDLQNPPPNTYFFLCTTQPEKIIKTIHDRSASFLFKAPNKDARKNILVDLFKQQKWGDTLSKEDKVVFFNALQGMSYRKILKTTEQVVTGGIDTLKDILNIPLGDEKSQEFNVVRYIFDTCIYRPWLDEYKNISSDQLYEWCINEINNIDNFQPQGFRRICLGSASNRLLKKTNTSKNKATELIKLHFLIKTLEKPYYESDGCLANFLVDLYTICKGIKK